jgi:hypothetical protein
MLDLSTEHGFGISWNVQLLYIAPTESTKVTDAGEMIPYAS